MMHALKLTHSGPGGHQYKKVPLNSDSEDDETTLYAAASLNEHSRSQSDSLSFGMGIYDHSRDLDLPHVLQLPSKKEQALRKRYNKLRSIFSLCIMMVVIVIAVVIVSWFLVLVNTGYFAPSASSTLTPEPSCFPIPKPLSNNNRLQPCETQPTTMATPPSTPHPSTSEPSRLTTEPEGDHGGEPSRQMTESEHAQTSTTTTQRTSTPPPQTTDGVKDTPTSTRPPQTTDGVKDTPTSTRPPQTNHVTDDVTDTPSTPQHASEASPSVPKEATTSTTHIPDDQQEDTPLTPQHPSEAGMENPTERPNLSPRPLSPTSTTAAKSENDTPPPNDHFLPSVPPTLPEESCYPVPEPLPNRQVKPCPTPSDIAPGRGEAAVTTDKVTEVTGQSPNEAVSTAEPHPLASTDETSSAVTAKPLKDTETESTTTIHPARPTPGATPTSTQDTLLHWEKEVMPGMTETSPQLYDANRDGVNDILTVLDHTPCQAKVLAMNGADGSTIWEQVIHFPAFAIRCILDVNMDGALDCLVTGRISGFVALDGTDGTVLWYVDHSIVFTPYNFYFPLVLADMNDDGVDDIINIHGGDSKYNPEEHDRSPAFLVAVSGKTGQTLMEPIPMPDGHESYSSPVLFARNSSNEFVLFGSGGETVPGSLWAIELTSLRMRVALHHTQFVTSGEVYSINVAPVDACMFDRGSLPSMARPVFNSTMFSLVQTMAVTSLGHLKCPMWTDRRPLWNDYNVCLYEIARGTSKGVILPPVVVDMTLDGVRDLVVSMYDGSTSVLDGRDMSTVVWKVDHPGSESYSLAAPIFYTSDDVPDLVIRTNIGAWPEYNVSTIRVLDGSDGSLLWSFNSTHSGMMSTVSVISKTHGRDALVFLALGVEGGEEEEEEEGSEVQRRGRRSESRPLDGRPRDQATANEGEGRGPRHATHDEETLMDPPDLWVSTTDDPVPDPRDVDAMLQYCGMSKSKLTSSIYMVTREMIDSGMEIIPLASYEPYVYMKEQPNTMSKRHEEGADEDNDSEEDDSDLDFDPHKVGPVGLRCGHISSPTSLFTTPLIGDFDDDGRLDITYAIVWGSAFEGAFKTLMVASDLERLFVGAYGKEILDFTTFLSPDQQPWTQYMGQRGDNVFVLPKT